MQQKQSKKNVNLGRVVVIFLCKQLKLFPPCAWLQQCWKASRLFSKIFAKMHNIKIIKNPSLEVFFLRFPSKDEYCILKKIIPRILNYFIWTTFFALYTSELETNKENLWNIWIKYLRHLREYFPCFIRNCSIIVPRNVLLEPLLSVGVRPNLHQPRLINPVENFIRIGHVEKIHFQVRVNRGVLPYMEGVTCVRQHQFFQYDRADEGVESEIDDPCKPRKNAWHQ